MATEITANKMNKIPGMQNLSISCSLVCMIILGSAALVGAFGVCQRQISAILITGVMYLLAGMCISYLYTSLAVRHIASLIPLVTFSRIYFVVESISLLVNKSMCFL